jgi:AraC-like DNA-binding protein
MVDAVLFNVLARGVAVGAFTVTGLALAADRRPTPARWVGALFFACVVAHVVDGFHTPEGQHANTVIWGMSIAATGLFWAFAQTLFADEARSPVRLLWPTAVQVALWAMAKSLPEPLCRPVWLACNLVSAALVVHALMIVWRGWRGDLVVERRRLRGPVMVAAAGYILLLVAQDMVWLSGLPLLHVTAGGQAAILAVLGLAAAVALLRAEPLLVEAPIATGEAAPVPQKPVLDLTPADRLVLARLRTAMDENEVWRGEDLSITALAALVGAPEHRLRRLINGVLGHRNFADYVNGRRIEAAKAALADPDLALKSVSTIAYDLGFASLGPFNRAFRAATGVTPSAWRSAKTPTSASPHLRLVETADPASKTDKSA